MNKTNHQQQILIRELDDLERAVSELLSRLDGRRILAFSGEIGAGKTTFIQTLCRRLGASAKVTSPTFSLVNEYPLPGGGEEDVIYHLDLYRLENMQEALDIGIEEYLYSPAYCFIEWPEIIDELLPEDTLRIKLSILDDSTRKMLLL